VERRVALWLLAISLAVYGVYYALHAVAMLPAPTSTLLWLAVALQAVLAIVAAVGVWLRQRWAAAVLLLLGAAVAATALIEAFVLGIAAWLPALLIAVVALVIALLGRRLRPPARGLHRKECVNSLQEVRIGAQPLERFRALLGEEALAQAYAAADRMRRMLARRVVWNVNSTAVGGGVAEMLQSLLGYARGFGIDTRWMVIGAHPGFFGVTKRIHHALHGSAGDGSPLGEAEHRLYQEALLPNALELSSLVREGDFVLLHDPQTAGMARPLLERGAHVIWRCHVGRDAPVPEAERGWAFLRPYLEPIPSFVFSRAAYIPDFCDPGKARVIQPSIDGFSAKNQALDEATVRTILVHVGLVEGPAPEENHGFVRHDGTPSRVQRRADVVRLGRAPAWDTPLVVQVSRWDPLKDPVGVLHAFLRLVGGSCPAGAELVLAGPNVNGVTDDPEGPRVFDDVVQAWRRLPHAVRDRVHLATLPTADVEENAAIVNALQRHAAVVVQKSLHEGFGLTVAEAMWKERAVVASAVGGIQDQIEDGRNGLLLKDPADLDGLAAMLRSLLADGERRQRMGQAARERVREKFLGIGHLLQYARLFEELEAGSR
jgi:trehalose synthase